jgi:thiamine monophosphate synthase
MSRLTAGMLEAGVIPGDLDAFKEEAGKIKLYFGGGGGGGPTQSTSYQTNIPEYAEPYASEVFGKAQALTDTSQNPFPQYGGERTAGFSPLQQQAFTGVQQAQPSGALSAGIDVSANVAQQAGQYQGYNPLQAQQMYQAPEYQQMGLNYLMTQAPQLQQFGMGPAERVRTGSFAQPGTAEAYMSPYMQNVVDVQQREARRASQIAAQEQAAGATSRGALGGSRDAIMRAERERNLGIQLGDIQAQGLQSAFQQAQQGYQTDAARRLQAALANQQAGLTVGGQNLSAALGVQQLGAQTGMQSQQLNQAAQLQAQQQALGQSQAANQFAQQNAQLAAQYGLAGLQAGEQSRQFGANLGLQGLQQQLAAAGQLGGLGQTQFGQEMGILEAQQRAGALQQQREQTQLDAAYQQFLAQKQYPYQQLGFMSDILRGVPATTSAQQLYQAPATPVNQLASLGLGAYGVNQLFGGSGKKKGGVIKKYKKGGVVKASGAGLGELAIHVAMGGK